MIEGEIALAKKRNPDDPCGGIARIGDLFETYRSQIEGDENGR